MATWLKNAATGGTGMMRGSRASMKSSDSGVDYSETAKFVVISDDKYEPFLNVLTTAGLPIVGLRYLGSGLKCVSKNATQSDDSPYIWFVDCELSTEKNDQEAEDPENPDPDPTTWIPIWTAGVEYYDQVIRKDFSTPPKLYMNTARCPFPEPLLRKSPLVIFNFTQYEPATLTIDEIADRNETVNVSSFKGFNDLTLLLHVKGFSKGYHYNKECYKVDYQVSYKKTNWLDKPLNIGYEYLTAAGKISADRLIFLEMNGLPRSDNLDPLELSFHTRPELDFADFIRV